MLKPNLFIPGFPKSGTSSLYSMLLEHPSIRGGKKKEPQTYSKDYIYKRRLSLFSQWSFKYLYNSNRKSRYIVDSSTSYLVYPKALLRIKNDTPDAKFIVIARDPIERIVSHYNWMVAMGKVENRFQSEMKNEGLVKFDPAKHYNGKYKNYVWFSLYGKHLSSLYKIFDRRSVLFLKFENLIENRERVLNEIWSFLNLKNANVELSHRNKTSKFKNSNFSPRRDSTIKNELRNFIWDVPRPLGVNNPIRNYIEVKDIDKDFLFDLLYEDLHQLNTLGIDLEDWSTTQNLMNKYFQHS